jgi:hypothetical protein
MHRILPDYWFVWNSTRPKPHPFTPILLDHKIEWENSQAIDYEQPKDDYKSIVNQFTDMPIVEQYKFIKFLPEYFDEVRSSFCGYPSNAINKRELFGVLESRARTENGGTLPEMDMTYKELLPQKAVSSYDRLIKISSKIDTAEVSRLFDHFVFHKESPPVQVGVLKKKSTTKT